MDSTPYELRPLLAEIRDGFRGMRAIRASLRAAEREGSSAARGARKCLERDLAYWTSPGGMDGLLDSIIRSYSEEEIAEMCRSIAARRAE